MDLLINLGTALALGLLIGIERGWHEREASEGNRIAGLRTFGLVALLGALWALLAGDHGAILLGFGFIGFALLVIAAQFAPGRPDRGFGVTTSVALLLTFAIGALVMADRPIIAAAVSAVSATLLGLKPVLHRWLQRLEQHELYATFKLLLISVVLLPLLPDQGYGPWQALNPYKIWWMVVLITAISFAGYFAVRIAGARRGLMITAMFAGLASSTALTLSFSRLGRQLPPLQPLLAAGVVIAAATMFPRILLEVAVIHRALLPYLLPPLLIMTAISYLAVPLLLHYTPEREAGNQQQLPLRNPFELLPALQFSALLALVLLLSQAAQQHFGDTGLYLVAAISGLTDVDAITLTLAQLAKEGLAPTTAVGAILIAATSNTLVKIGLVLLIAGRVMGGRVLLVFLLALSSGALTLWLLPPLRLDSSVGGG